MTNSDLEKFQKDLLEVKARIEKEISGTPDNVDFGDSNDQDTEEADEEIANDLQASKKDSLLGRLENIKSALNKIRNNTYGKCEICGEEIEKEILEIDPESRYCRKHKKQGY